MASLYAVYTFFEMETTFESDKLVEIQKKNNANEKTQHILK